MLLLVAVVAISAVSTHLARYCYGHKLTHIVVVVAADGVAVVAVVVVAVVVAVVVVVIVVAVVVVIANQQTAVNSGKNGPMSQVINEPS